MADYYAILARAVSGLEINSAQARQEMYEHARTVLIAHLDRSDPQRSALEIISEWTAVETAVRRVEATSGSVRERIPAPTLKSRLDALRKLHRDMKPAPESGTRQLVLERAE